jgi:hypothetical protein
MHVSDPGREPMLERAMRADAVPGSTIPENTEAEIHLRDGSWVWCQVIGQRKDRQGRWCVGLRWYASPSVGGREGWYLLDRSRIRRLSALTSGDHGHPGQRSTPSAARSSGLAQYATTRPCRRTHNRAPSPIGSA